MSSELWGTFSVSDHRRRRAFLTDVLLYDRLAIPVPDDDAEVERWSRRGRDPMRQKRLIEILESHAVPIPWTSELHDQWVASYADRGRPDKKGPEAGASRAGIAQAVEYDVANLADARERREDPDSIAQYVTRLVVARSTDFELNLNQIAGLPKVEVESVPAYGSLHDYQRQQTFHLEMSPVPGGRPVLMFEWPLLVPSDSKRGDEELLELAVALADRDETKEYRAAFHDWRRDMVLSGQCEEAALADLGRRAEDYRRAVRGTKIKTRVRYGLGVFAAAAGVAALAIPPLAPVSAVAALGTAVMDVEDAEVEDRLEAGAFLHEARRHLGGGR